MQAILTIYAAVLILAIWQDKGATHGESAGHDQ